MQFINRLAVTLSLLLLTAPAIRTGIVNAQSAQPIRTVSRGKARVYYYDHPRAVAVTTTFYVIGSQINSSWRDFLAISADFASLGDTLTTPDYVHLHFVSSTRTRGGKYQTDHRLTVMADDKLLLSTDLNVSGTTDNQRGGLLEVFDLPQMPFAQFTELAHANQVVMKFGKTEFKPKREHLEALRSMVGSIRS